MRTCGTARRNLEIDVGTTRPEVLVLSKEAVESAKAYSGRANSNPCITCGKQVPEGELHCVDCAPQPEEDLDTGRVGPLLVIIAVVGIVLAWIIVAAIVPGTHRQDVPKKSDTRIETSR